MWWQILGGACTAGLFYIYGGFAAILRGLAYLVAPFRRPQQIQDDEPLPITVFVSALNEAGKIGSRLEDLVRQDIPAELVEIIVISDGSTDATAAEAREYAARHPEHEIRVEEFPQILGRAAAQNLAVRVAKHDLLCATDVDTRFEKNVLRLMSAKFRDDSIGVVGARIEFGNRGSPIARSISLYWRAEMALRVAEERLGVSVKTGGPCTAFRRRVWEPIEPFEDVDHVVPLMARRHGFKTALANDAVAYDLANETVDQELRSRSRMARKTLLSIGHRWSFRDAVRHPLFTFILLSHRPVRLLSPILLFGFSVALFAAVTTWLGAVIAVVGVALASLLVLLGWRRVPVPVVGRIAALAWPFVLANVGFALGLAMWLRGDRSGAYRPIHGGRGNLR